MPRNAMISDAREKANMESEIIFRGIVPVLVIAFAFHRGYYVKNHSKPDEATLKKREEGLPSKVAGFLGLIGFVSILVFTINPVWLDFANLEFPTWLRWAGVGIAILGFALLQWAQVTLGKSWSDTPRMMKEQKLITEGPYQYIRHPIYTAFLLILGSLLLISSNWLIGLCMIGMTVLEIVSRMNYEESLMTTYFGEQYRAYMKKTGRLLPRLN
jgi:protein-S-isoprenylcysteine O-methyltransferase Ste14